MYTCRAEQRDARVDYLRTGNSGAGVDIYIIDRYVTL